MSTLVFSWSWTRDTQWRHKSKKSENLGWCRRQDMLQRYLKIWELEMIFSLGIQSPCTWTCIFRRFPWSVHQIRKFQITFWENLWIRKHQRMNNGLRIRISWNLQRKFWINHWILWTAPKHIVKRGFRQSLSKEFCLYLTTRLCCRE